MTYFGFLLRFLVPPIVVLGLLLLRDGRQGKRLPAVLRVRPAGWALLIHVLLAVVYTTPWDNYLVATHVWSYDPARVAGVTLGWVPIEEYTFFVLQTVLTGLWLIWLGRRLANESAQAGMPGRTSRYVLAGLVLAWVAAAAILLRGWAPGTYLALELIWLLPPIIAQVALGAGILWQQRRLVSAALFAPLLYLSAADSIAISAGAWTISPRQTTGFLVGGALPLEEFIFFLLTNVLIVFGMTLFMTLPLVVVWPWRRNELPRSVSEHEAKAQ